MRVRGLDHVVLRVADVERALTWYTELLGLEPERVDEWRRGEVLFPSVRVDASTIIDLLEAEPPGPGTQSDRQRAGSSHRNVDHLCFELDDVDIDELACSGRFDILSEPATLWGARGNGRSVYVRDPDDNVIELRTYS